MSPKRTMSDRRRFLQLVGLATLSAAVSRATPSPAAPRPAAKAAAPADTTQANAAPKISDDALALAAIVERRYGAHLTAEQLEGVRRDLQDVVDIGKALREVKLANHDEPDVVFHA